MLTFPQLSTKIASSEHSKKSSPWDDLVECTIRTLRPMHKNIPMICTIYFFLSCLDTKTHAAGAQKSRLNGRIPKSSQNTGPKPMHKDLSSVLTSRITYHLWILNGYSKEPSQWGHSHELPKHMPKPMHTSRYHMYISRYSKVSHVHK